MNGYDDARMAWRSAIVVQVLGVAGLALDAGYWLASHGRVLPSYLGAMAFGAILLVALLSRREPPRAVWSGLASIVCVAAVVFALWPADAILAREPRPWIPFQPHKLGVLAIALLAPTPAWVGVVCIATFTIAAGAQYLAFPEDVRGHLALGEPWGTCAFGFFALCVFVHRTRHVALERKAARAEAEAEALARLARVGLAVRDLSNTPLQTLRLSTALLRLRHPDESASIDPMDRALDRLEQLERTVSRYEAKTAWTRNDLSFDPMSVLESDGR